MKNLIRKILKEETEDRLKNFFFKLWDQQKEKQGVAFYDEDLLKKLGLYEPKDKRHRIWEYYVDYMVGQEVLDRFTPIQANEKTPLVITINSFSYKKGLPSDASENGGGFIFDMRGILNPGRFDEYKKLSGLDKPVQDFLEQKTKMNTFINSVWDLIDITVENYLARDFESLQINFGCTGGQHRSVFAAEQTARHLKNKYKVKVVLAHTNQTNWVK
jgi:hypothetical protein